METYISLLLSRVRPPLCAHCLHNLGNGVSCGAVIVAFGVQKIVFFFSPPCCAHRSLEILENCESTLCFGNQCSRDLAALA